METIQYTDARNKLNKVIDAVDKNKEPVLIIGSKGRKDTVLLSKEDYDNLIENLYILSNPAWVKSVEKGRKELKSGKGKKLSTDEALGL